MTVAKGPKIPDLIIRLNVRMKVRQSPLDFHPPVIFDLKNHFTQIPKTRHPSPHPQI